MSTSTVESLGVGDLEAALVEARADAVAYRQMALAALDRLQELTQRLERAVEVNARLHDEIRQLGAAQRETAA